GHHGVTVLATAARLANEFAFAFGALGNRLAISDLRRTGIGADFELAEQTVANNLQVQFAHPGNNQLAGFFVGEATEGRIFFGQALQTFAHLFAISFGLGFDRHRNNRFRERWGLEHDLEVLVAQSVTRGDVSDTDQCGDVAGVGRIHIDPFIGLDHQHAADALALARARIVNYVTLLQLPAVNA